MCTDREAYWDGKVSDMGAIKGDLESRLKDRPDLAITVLAEDGHGYSLKEDKGV
jgi:hypothetical protein